MNRLRQTLTGWVLNLMKEFQVYTTMNTYPLSGTKHDFKGLVYIFAGAPRARLLHQHHASHQSRLLETDVPPFARPQMHAELRTPIFTSSESRVVPFVGFVDVRNGQSRLRRLPIPSLSEIRRQIARDNLVDGSPSNGPAISSYPPRIPDAWVVCSGCFRNWAQPGRYCWDCGFDY